MAKNNQAKTEPSKKATIKGIAEKLYNDFYIKEFPREGRTEPERRTLVKHEGLGHDLIMIFYDFKLDQDSIYDFCRDYLGDISSIDYKDIEAAREGIFEIADSNTDVYTHNLTEWLSRSNYNVYYLDEALSEYQPEDGFKALALAQMKAREEVYEKVLSFIENQLESEQKEVKAMAQGV